MVRFLKAKLAACQSELKEALRLQQALQQESADLRKQASANASGICRDRPGRLGRPRESLPTPSGGLPRHRFAPWLY